MNRSNDLERASEVTGTHRGARRQLERAQATTPDALWSTLGRIVPLTLYSMAVLYFGTRQHLTFPGDEVLSQDKVLHALAFGGLGVLAYRSATYLWPQLHSRLIVASAIGFATFVGGALELIQWALPYRSMELGDLIADAIGATLCVAIAKRLHLERPLFNW